MHHGAVPRPLPRLETQRLTAFTAPMQELAVELLIYKGIFVGDWFGELAAQERDPTLCEVLSRLREESEDHAKRLLDALERWEAVAVASEAVAAASVHARRRLVEDLLTIKEGATECIVAAAMHAPTERMRTELLVLADVDRQHADALRRHIGATSAEDAVRRKTRVHRATTFGAHDGRTSGATLSDSVRDCIASLAHGGHQPSRIYVSSVALRHLRDEGSIPEGEFRAFGLPVHLDLGWHGECWSVATQDRVSLAEILALDSEGADPEGR